MKKGFTMIELIFVIVILGILASVAIPRLAGTREDAEIATTIANLRTLLSDASGHYVAKGTFGTAKWQEFTNVPLEGAGDQAATTGTAATAHLKVGGANCIGLYLVEKNGNIPAHIKFTGLTATPGTPGSGPTGVCAQVIAKDPVQAFVNSKVKYGAADADKVDNAIAIGSSSSVYSN